MAIDMFSLFYKFFLSLALGALIGMEREKRQQHHKGTDFAGIRTFMLITFFGAMSAYLSSLYYSWLLAVIIVCFTLVILSGYVLSSFFNKDSGMTTEISAVIAFIIGILVFRTSQEIPILLTIVITLILSFKGHLHKFVYRLKSIEFFDTIKFVLIAFVILPLLKPIAPFGPFNSINLYEIWLMVVFVTGLNYIGYILIKTFGSNKGAVLTGLLGGILSSTAVVTSLANKSKEQEKVTPFVTASAIASSTMFLRVLIEVSILNFSMIEKLAFPMVLLSLAGYAAASIMWRKKEHGETHLEFKSPLMLKPALKFGLFYSLILFVSNLSKFYLGSKGILLASVISGLADVDAITIFVARSGDINLGLGILAITLAAIVNTGVKIVIGKMFGTRDYSINLTKVLAPVIVTGLFLLILL